MYYLPAEVMVGREESEVELEQRTALKPRTSVIVARSRLVVFERLNGPASMRAHDQNSTT